jgi:hypothetical protein
MSAATYQSIVERWAKRYKIRVRWIADVNGSTAYWPTRTVRVPRIRSDEDLAVAAHECGHIIAGKCPGRSPHQREQLPTSLACLACECAATRIAEFLVTRAGVPWTRAMHDRLSRGLASYRRIPAPAAQRQVARTLASDSRYAARLQERLELERRLEQHREIQELIARL